VVLGEDEFRLLDVAEELTLGIRPSRAALDAGQKVLAEQALRLLRHGLERGDSRVEAVALGLLRALPSTSQSSLSLPTSASAPPGFLLDLLEGELFGGKIFVRGGELPSLRERPSPELPELPPLPRRKETEDSFYELEVVDEIGKGISGLTVAFTGNGFGSEQPTNAAGIALLEGVPGTGAQVRVVDETQLERLVDPRWASKRSGTVPDGARQARVLFDGAELRPLQIGAVHRHTLVVAPRLGKIFVELLDKTGRAAHALRPYTISGPESLAGTTDVDGRLLHEGVLPGEYTLSFEAEVDLVTEKKLEPFTTTVLAVAAAQAHPQVRMLGALPRVRLARLKGMFFDTNKSFLLPASTAVFDRLSALYAENVPSELLIVGHADTTADAKTNDPLSLERAESTRAFLEDDVDAWLDMYTTKVPESRRWGADEDGNMLFALADFADKPEDEDPVRFFQRTRGLTVDGIAGPVTRRQLIKEYMAQDGVSLGSGDFDIRITTHGCGENFPLDDSGEELDEAPEDRKEDQVDRRVELFFFDREFGILPPPPGKNSGPGSTQYPEWRRRAALSAELAEGAGVVEVVLFRSDGEPLADEPFEVLFPDGRIKTGQLDGDGRAKVSGIAGSDLKIRFPKLGDIDRVPA